MYLSNKKHYLSNALSFIAVINLVLELINVLVRKALNQTEEFDMLNDAAWYTQVCFQSLTILVTFIVFYSYIHKLKKIRSEYWMFDNNEIALFQRQHMSENISSLSLKSITQLFLIWGAILVWSQFMYIVTSYQYRSFIAYLYEMIPADDLQAQFEFGTIYNSTHGFKYIGMITALILGIFITGIYLHDKVLVITAISIAGVFLLAFVLFQMSIISTSGIIVSIVWTSIIYHSLETIGLLALAFYLSKHYKGL